MQKFIIGIYGLIYEACHQIICGFIWILTEPFKCRQMERKGKVF